MGLLDDLKKQSQDLQAQHADHRQASLRSIQLVEAAARTVRSHLMELAGHLDVIRPLSRRAYAIDKRLLLQGQPMVDFRFDSRVKSLRDQPVIDHVHMVCSVRGGRRETLSKDFVNEYEALERRLQQAGAPFEREAVRNHQNGKLIEMRYAFDLEVQLSARVECRHDDGRLHFTLRNLDGLETVTCEFEPHLVTQARLDELGRWWIGEPNRFLEGAAGLRRIEAR